MQMPTFNCIVPWAAAGLPETDFWTETSPVFMERLSTPSAAELSTLIGANEKHSSKAGLVWILVLLIVAAIAYFAWRKFQAPAKPLLTYTTEKVIRGDLNLAITATGNLEPTNEVIIGSVLSGNAGEVYVDINDRVKKDQELAKIIIRRLDQDTDNSRAALTSSKSRVKQVEATLMENEATLGRLQELYQLSSGRTPSKAEMATATAAVARAHADVDSANASVIQAEATLEANLSDQDRAILRSPIDGVVLTRSLEPGQTVAASFNSPELFVIAENLEHMKLKVAVAEADIGRVAQGQKANFTVDAWPDRTYSAKVTRVSFGSAVTDNVVTYETELEVSNVDLSLRPGMTATADIQVAESHNVLMVPATALRFDPVSASALLSKSGGAGGSGGEKKSFVQSLIPSPRRSGSGGPRKGDENEGSAKSKLEQSRVWILRDGSPVAIPVKVGLSDGRLTEVSGEGLTDGAEVIIRASSTSPQI
jgi:HlyD family secretion protein